MAEQKGAESDEPLQIHDVVKEERACMGLDPEKVRSSDQRHAQERRAAPQGPGPIGLALSGGGIRSATFGLGVLQALAMRKRLASFDYLSTVSGGGYIGSWLSAWIYRSGLDEVQNQLALTGSGASQVPRSLEPPEVTWLRRYSNYLAPRVGLFSLDSLTLAATWVRNVALNLIVVVSMLSVVFLLPLTLLDPLARVVGANRAFGFGAAWVSLIFLTMIGFNLWHQGLTVDRRRNWLISTPGVLISVLTPGIVAAGLGSIWLFPQMQSDEGSTFAILYAVFLLLILLAFWLISEIAKHRRPIAIANMIKEALIYSLAAAVALAVGIGVLTVLHIGWQQLTAHSNETLRLALLISFGPTMFTAGFAVSSTVFTGLVGRTYYERSREWWSRLNAWLSTVVLAWLVLCLLAFFALPVLQWITNQLGSWIALLGSGWMGSLLAAVFIKKPDNASHRRQWHTDQLLNVAASIFVIGLLIVIAAGTSAAIIIGIPGDLESTGAVGFTDSLDLHFDALAHLREMGGLLPGLDAIPSAFLSALAVLALFGWRVDINKFSLHNMYKNRLVRCYLGASNQGNRNEQPFTGLDDADDIELSHLADPSSRKVQRPFHIINATLNISQGSNLAWQERKAASFIFTPLHCGFALAKTQGDTTTVASEQNWETLGYRPTAQYGAEDLEEKGFSLGMALATSGASVSPNMGHATKPALAFVLTIFNIRLGRWSANPARRKWHHPSPRLGLLCLLQEMLGYSNERRNFIYVSDGGHFDNLGLYELVRRRCSLIFAVDAGQDPERRFADLADAARKCRVDLGVEIEIDYLQDLRGDESMRSERSFTTGRIRYIPDDPAKDGMLVLIKPSLPRLQNEPPDILNYAERNSPFPQQTTTDQFFDEGQFESYRRLGVFCADQCLEQHQSLLTECPAPPVARIPARPQEPPAFVTTWLSRLLFWRDYGGSELPKRDGSVADFFALLTIASALLMVIFAAFDRVFLALSSGGFCLSVETCKQQIMELFEALPERSPIWRDPVFWRMQLDNVFVVFYTGMFITAFLTLTVSTRAGGLSKAMPAVPKRVVMILCAIAICTATVDYVENFRLLAALGSHEDASTIADGVAPTTLLKFQCLLVCIVSLLVFAPWVFSVMCSRWRQSPTGRRVSEGS